MTLTIIASRVSGTNERETRRTVASGGWGLVSINNDEIERHNATVCKNRVIVVSANVKYESQLGNAFTTVDSRKAISGIVTRKRFLLGASEPQCKRDLYFYIAISSFNKF